MSDRPVPPADSPAPAPSSGSGEPVEISDEPFPLTEPAGEDDEKTPRSRTRTIVLSSLLVVALAGATAIGYAAWRVADQKDATLTAPEQIGALRLDMSDDGRATAEYLQTALSADVDFDKAIGGVYSDGSPNNVLFFGGTTLFLTPGSDLDTAFEIVADDQGSVTALEDVDPGPLGGTMKCGTTKSDGTDLPVCGWADHGSLALAMFPGRDRNAAAELLVQIRDAAQTRS